jgi:hypothetical protein
MLGAILIGFLTALLYCAVVILVAYAFVWGLRFLGVNIDGDVFKWGKVVVALICIIVMLTWLLGALGLGGGTTSRYFRLGGAYGSHASTPTGTTVHMPRVLI